MLPLSDGLRPRRFPIVNVALIAANFAVWILYEFPVQSAAGRSLIEPCSSWQNPFVESFGSRVRDEVLSVEAFDSVLEAQTVITDWRTIYNHRRPRSSLGWRPPRPMPPP